MSKEPTWLDAATRVLEKSDEAWMTAPELVRSIEKSGIRSLRSDYSQAVRTLRSALNYESKKDSGNFLRKDYNFNCYFALRRLVEDSKMTKIERIPAKRVVLSKPGNRKRKPATCVQFHSPEQFNGCSSSPTTPLSPALSPVTPTVEIDPCVTHQQKDGSSGLCLPSPLTSLLGPRRTLNVLNESVDAVTQRPVREARKRRITKDMENEDPLDISMNGPSSPLSTHSEEMLQLDFCHPLPCHCSSVDCVRSLHHGAALKNPLREDPCSAQGSRPASERIEINPNYIHKQETDSDDSNESISDGDSDSIHLQPTPSSQLLVKRRRRRRSSMISDKGSRVDNSESDLAEVSSMDSPRLLSDVPENESSGLKKHCTRPRSSVSSVKSVSSVGGEGKDLAGVDRIGKVPEQRRHVSTLFLPTSPLLNENLKTLLGMKSFENLNQSQKQKLVSHLPTVDQQNGTSIPEDCFSNSFYSSGLREWSERVALGMFTAEYKARVRGEEKRKISLKPENSWKKQYYERHYGEKEAGTRDNSPPPFYPYTPPSANTELLTSIVDGYYRRDSVQNECPPPSPPPHQTAPIATPMPTPISPRHRKNQKKPATKEINLNSVKRPPKSATTSTKPPKIKSARAGKLKVPEKKSSLNSAVKKNNSTVSSLLSTNAARKSIKKKSTAKRLGTTSSQLSQVLMHQLLAKSMELPREFLTRLPAKMSYQEILQNLISASVESPAGSQGERIVTYSAPFEHTHPVFHDHFALLSKEHVPVDFCFRVASLPLSVPLTFYEACLYTKAITREHSYAKTQTSPHPKTKSFTLSLPRSLLISKNGCVCDGQALVFCSVCHSLYHSNCSADTTLCPTCFVHQQQN